MRGAKAAAGWRKVRVYIVLHSKAVLALRRVCRTPRRHSLGLKKNKE